MDQDTLFELPPPSAPPGVFRPELFRPGSRRPHRMDNIVILAAAKALAESLVREHPSDFKVNQLDELAEQLADEIYATTDGFDLGRRLSDRGWTVDFELTETLDGAEDCVSEAEDEAVAAWVIGAGITPAFAVGEHVLVDNVYAGGLGQRRLNFGTTEMTIRAIDAKQATYTVYALAAGHMSDEQLAENERAIRHEHGAVWRGGTTGQIFEFEGVRRPFCYGCGWPNSGGVCLPLEVV